MEIVGYATCGRERAGVWCGVTRSVTSAAKTPSVGYVFALLGLGQCLHMQRTAEMSVVQLLQVYANTQREKTDVIPESACSSANLGSASQLRLPRVLSLLR